MPPLISVIIVCRNPGPRLHDAIASVREQTFKRIELLVIDGASTDGTRDWLERNREGLAIALSESDAGIYDAMNKGVARAGGEWILFLGADDRLTDRETLDRAAGHLRRSSADVVSAEARFDDGRVYRFEGTQHAIRRNFIHHQATFYRRALFARHGGFDQSLRLQADYECNLRLLRAGAVFEPLLLRVADCGAGGASDSGKWLNYREEIVVRHRHFPAMQCILWDLGSIVRCLRKKLLRSSHPHG